MGSLNVDKQKYKFLPNSNNTYGEIHHRMSRETTIKAFLPNQEDDQSFSGALKNVEKCVTN